MTCHIDLESIRILRKALIIGLGSLGEIERLSSRWETLQIGDEQPNHELKPVLPYGTGSAETVGDFADALACLDIFESELREA